jgi:glycosyltransferase involved in cell wall biosynthesis
MTGSSFVASGRKDEAMDLSVIIPVHNRANGIRWTLHSLTEQRPAADVEVIVVDDGSTDNAPAVVAEFDDRLDLTLVRNEVNSGRCVARNRGAAVASGERLLFLDADSYADPDLLALYGKWHRARPDDVLLGRRVEIGWRSLNQLAREGRVSQPLNFEEDLRYPRGLTGNDDDTYARMPWLFAFTHNMSVPAGVFHAVGGFDDSMGRVFYEDNDLAYRVFQHFGRRTGHFRYDPALVCYHLPHLREGSAAWAHTTDVVAYLKNKYRHFDLELLNNPPSHHRVAHTLPYYEAAIAYVRGASRPDVPVRVAKSLPPPDGGELWIGCGVTAANEAGRDAEVFDHALPASADNYHLIGLFLPYPDGSLARIVSVDLWRMLNPVDLGAFVKEALRVAETLYLAMSTELTGDERDYVGLATDVYYLTDMLADAYAVTTQQLGDGVTVIRCERPKVSAP